MKPKDYAEIIQACRWMADLQESERTRVHQDLRVQIAEPGDVLCRSGEVAEQWVGVLSGLVKIAAVSAAGKTLAYTGVAPSGWFGEGVLLRRGVWPCDAIALRRSHIGLLPAGTFFWLMDRSLVFNRVIINQLNERLGQFIGQLQIERISGSDERVAHTLAAMFHPVLYPGVGHVLRITQDELGQLCSLSRQRVNQALQRLMGLGLLRLRYGGIEVPDAQRLRAFGAGMQEMHAVGQSRQPAAQFDID